MKYSEINSSTKLNIPICLGVAGQSEIKLLAVENAIIRLGLHLTYSGIAISSTGVDEQPVGYSKIYEGARKRAKMAKIAYPELDIYIGIENGIEMIEDTLPETWVDYAIVFAITPESIQAVRSDKCVFPTDAVLATSQLSGGFKQNTVGKYMANQKMVSKHDDPHIDLCGKSRLQFLEDAVFEVLLYIFPKMRVVDDE